MEIDAVIGRIVIGSNNLYGKRVDRAEYISNCQNTGIVRVVTSDSGGLNVQLLNGIVNKNDGLLVGVDFPLDDETFGSQVLCIRFGMFGWFGILLGNGNKGFTLEQENQAVLMKKSDDPKNSSFAKIDERGETGDLIFTASSNQSNGGNITQNAHNDNKTGTHKVNADLIKERAENKTSEIMNKLDLIIKDLAIQSNFTELSYELTKGFSFVDEWGNSITQNADSIIVNHTKAIQIGDGSSKAIKDTLIDNLKTMFDDLKSFLSNLDSIYKTLTVVASSFGAPTTTPANVLAMTAAIEAEKAKLDISKTEIEKSLSTYLTIQ